MTQNVLVIRDDYDIPDGHFNDPTLSHLVCPKCHLPGRWRTGVYFDHQKICAKCSIVWCPFEIIAYRNALSKSLGND